MRKTRMTTYDDRQKGFERKFAHDEELAFKAKARRNKLLGLWAAGKLGKDGADADAYANDVVMADFESHGDDDMVTKVLDDFVAAKLSVSAREIIAEMERLLPIARQQVVGSEKTSVAT